MFSKLDFDYFSKLDNDPATAPTEFGSFRECVVPVVEAGRADLVTGPYRLDEFIEILPAGGHSPGHFFFNLNVGGNRATLIGDVFHHLLQVYYPDWNFPKNSNVEEARVSRRSVLDDCASSGALVFPGHVGFPFAGLSRRSARRLQAAASERQRRATTLASRSLAVLLTTISSTANLPRSAPERDRTRLSTPAAPRR